MKFEEFRSLIEERKRLVHGVDKEKNYLRIKEIDKKLCPEKYGKYKDLDKSIYLDWMKSAINLLFEVGRENVIKILESFFKDKAEICCNMHNNSIFVETQPIQKCTVYYLGKYNEILYCLCGDGQEEWEKLLHDYPDLREYLWENFKGLKQQDKRAQVSLIQKMLKEKNQEQEVLENPELREAKISEIRKEKRELESMLSLVENSFDEI